MQIATGLVPSDAGVDAFAEAASRAQLGLGGAPADLVAVFAASANLDSIEDGMAAVEARLGSRGLMGCGAQGVLGDGREVEEGGVVVWAASLDGGEVQSFHLEPVGTGDGGLVIAGLPELDDADAVFMIADPYTFPVEPLLAQMADDYPGLPVVGGLASAAGPDGTVLLHDDAVVNSGAVGAVLRGVEVHTCVSQGARPIGPEMVITAGEGELVHELASRPVLSRPRSGPSRPRASSARARSGRSGRGTSCTASRPRWPCSPGTDQAAAKTCGRRSAHGRASSSCDASDRSISSAAGAPTNCTPTGRPPGVVWSGTDIAGWPVTLETGVNRTNVAALISI